MDDRREFLKKAGAAAIGAAVMPGLAHGRASGGATPGDGPGKDLLMAALQTARDAGASYADARLGRYRRQSVSTRERQVTEVSEAESFGIGIRALVNGSWGFAATRDLTKASVQAAAGDAVRIARAAARFQKRPVVLAPVAPVVGAWQTPVERDPLDVPLEERFPCCSPPMKRRSRSRACGS
jgi:TldD protein